MLQSVKRYAGVVTEREAAALRRTRVPAHPLLLYLITGTLKQKIVKSISSKTSLMQIYISIRPFVLEMYWKYMNMKVSRRVRKEEKRNIVKRRKKIWKRERKSRLRKLERKAYKG